MSYTKSNMYIYTLLCRYWITLHRYVLVVIVYLVDHEIEDNKQFISSIMTNDCVVVVVIYDHKVFNLLKREGHDNHKIE
jgi:hypothetical protein